MKKIIIAITSLLILLLFLAIPKTALAQGTYSCTYINFACGVFNEHCDVGYEPDESLCWNITDAVDCNATSFSCISKTPCTGDSGSTGFCFSWAWECPEPDWINDGIGTCTVFPQGCCVPASSSPGEPGEIESFQPDECMSSLGPGISTALGCIPTHPLNFIGTIRNILIGIIGGVALLLMIVGAFFVLTSQGNPEQIKRGKEIFVGAITGVVFIIFTWFLLNLIGVDLLDLFITL